MSPAVYVQWEVVWGLIANAVSYHLQGTTPPGASGQKVPENRWKLQRSSAKANFLFFPVFKTVVIYVDT